MKNNENLTIKTIICKPRSLDRYEYIINNNDKHVMEKKDLTKFLNDHVNGYNSLITRLLRDNLPFIVLKETDEIIELKFNYKKELENLKSENKKIEAILKSTREKDSKNEKSTDKLDKFIDLSNLINKNLT